MTTLTVRQVIKNYKNYSINVLKQFQSSVKNELLSLKFEQLCEFATASQTNKTYVLPKPILNYIRRNFGYPKHLLCNDNQLWLHQQYVNLIYTPNFNIGSGTYLINPFTDEIVAINNTKFTIPLESKTLTPIHHYSFLPSIWNERYIYALCYNGILSPSSNLENDWYLKQPLLHALQLMHFYGAKFTFSYDRSYSLILRNKFLTIKVLPI